MTDTRDTRSRDEPQKSSYKARGDADRVSMGGYTQQLTVSGLPEGYTPRWVNNDSDRIQQSLNAGYIPMLKDGGLGDPEVSGGDLAHENEWVSKVVGETQFGPLVAYLMVIRTEWFKEGQARKQAPMELFDKAIKEGSSFDPTGNMVNDPTTYTQASTKTVDLKR